MSTDFELLITALDEGGSRAHTFGEQWASTKMGGGINPTGNLIGIFWETRKAMTGLPEKWTDALEQFLYGLFGFFDATEQRHYAQEFDPSEFLNDNQLSDDPAGWQYQMQVLTIYIDITTNPPGKYPRQLQQGTLAHRERLYQTILDFLMLEVETPPVSAAHRAQQIEELIALSRLFIRCALELSSKKHAAAPALFSAVVKRLKGLMRSPTEVTETVGRQLARGVSLLSRDNLVAWNGIHAAYFVELDQLTANATRPGALQPERRNWVDFLTHVLVWAAIESPLWRTKAIRVLSDRVNRDLRLKEMFESIFEAIRPLARNTPPIPVDGDIRPFVDQARIAIQTNGMMNALSYADYTLERLISAVATLVERCVLEISEAGGAQFAGADSTVSFAGAPGSENGVDWERVFNNACLWRKDKILKSTATAILVPLGYIAETHLDEAKDQTIRLSKVLEECLLSKDFVEQLCWISAFRAYANLAYRHREQYAEKVRAHGRKLLAGRIEPENATAVRNALKPLEE